MRRPLRPPSAAGPLLLAALLAVPVGGARAQGASGPLEPGGARLRLETELRESNLDADAPRPTFARGDSVDGRTNRETTLEGNAEVRRGGTVIRGDRLTIYEADDEVVAVGNVRIAREGTVFTGPELILRLDANEGSFASPRYYVPATGARGEAERADFLGRGEVEMTNATYTTCKPDDPDWYLRAESFTLDRSADEGSARWATLYFKDVPIFKAPAVAFPLGDERRSGFLPPTLSISSTYGTEVRVPYYWNIAPNRDFTLYTNATARRGLQVGGLARYLEPQSNGATRFEYNPNDIEAAASRWMIDSTHTVTNWNGFSGGWVVRGVSDDSYYVDYSRTIAQSAERSLPRSVFVTRAFGDTVVTARALAYQNILEARSAPAYDRMPQITALHSKRDLAGFDFLVAADASDFRRDLANSAQGARMIVNPSIAYPFGGPAWFLTPKASVHATSYRLEVNPVGPESIDRVVPTFSLDSGLVFERTTTLGSRDMIQTLEPRLLYVYTPYRDQSQIPVFDSAVANLSFATLFNEQLFVGGDRIADANQITAGAVSRFIEPSTGIESLRLGAAQRVYFNEQRVTLPGVPTRTYSRSDVLLVASGNLGGGHNIDAGVQVSVAEGAVPRFGVSWRFWPAHDRLFNVALRYQERDYAQIDTSWRWPISRRWNTLGRVNYSVLREGVDPATGVLGPTRPQLLEGVFGLEYAADCWITRFVAQRYVTTTAQRTSAFFVQLELNGLARIGLDPFDILTRNIPGYRPPSTRPATPSRFFGYE
ncbi:MAG: LPS-assembly protein LptD [Burkholderiales bacterium]|nr:MAG: LPS-assembly protein LptD [Burkholderiales bacterium]